MVSRPIFTVPLRLPVAAFLVALVAGFGGLAPASGQTPALRFQHLNQQDGLSMDTVETIHQDRRGFIWMGTQDGLLRWDGVQMRVYRPQVDDPHSLSSGYIETLAEDAQGRLWIGTNRSGLDSLDPETGHFSHLRHDPDSPASLSSDEVEALLVVGDRYLLIGTSAGLDRLDLETRALTHFRAAKPTETGEGAGTSSPALPVSSLPILALHQDGAGRVWAGSLQGLLRVEPGSGTLTPALPPNGRRHGSVMGARAGSGEEIRSIAHGPDGSLWWVTPRSLVRYSPETGQRRVFRHDPANPWGLGDADLRKALVDSSGRVWVAGLDGLYLLHHLAQEGPSTFYHWQNQSAEPESLANNNVLSLKQDRGGLLWVGMVSGGVDRVDPRDLAFGFYSANAEARQGLSGGIVYAFAEGSDGDLWIGTFGGGAFRWDRSAGEFLPLSEEILGAATSPDSTVPGKRLTSLLVDRRGQVWLGTYDAGLQVFDPASGRLRRVPLRTEGRGQSPRDGSARPAAKAEQVISLFEDSQGAIWVGTLRSGLARLRGPGSEPEIFRASDNTRGAIRDDRVPCLAEDREGRLWVGTLAGLALFDRQTSTFTHFGSAKEASPQEPDPGGTAIPADGPEPVGASAGELRTTLTSHYVLSLHVDPEGRLWLGTQEGGISLLERFDADEGTAAFRTWTRADGLANDTVYGIHSDARGHLWISTNQGLTRLDPDSGQLKGYGRRHGLQALEFNAGAHFETSDGEMLFGGNYGFNAFYPEEVDFLVRPPAVAASSVHVRGGPWEAPKPVREGLGPIELDHRHTVIAFDLAVLDFASPAENRQAYRLDPFDAEWIESPAGRQAVYTNLAPGEYLFRARGANADGVWSETQLAIPISVKPAPWRTWWAYTGYLMMIVGIAYLGVRWRIRGLEKRGAELEDLVHQRTAELSETVDRLQVSETSALEAKRRALKSLEEALDERRKAQEANRAKSTFLSNMSHELRTPLNAMLGFAQLMQRAPDLSLDHNNSLGVIVRSGEHLLGLINDVLSLSKIEAGRSSLSTEPFDPRHLVKKLEAMLRVKIEEKGLDLEVEIEPEVPKAVLGDPGRLTQILLNLASNAIKFTDRGRVDIGLGWSTEKGLAFEVADTGCGIPPEDLDELFEPFSQTEAGKSAKEGTGLGLAISSKLVSLMGGKLEVESKVGRGSTFSFALPLESTDEVVPVGLHETVVGLVPDQASLRVLVVDDALENRELLRRIHEEIGIETRTAETGRQAVEIWGSWRPDFIWMDMRMPELDGYEATRRIRRAEAELDVQRTLIVALTATAFEHDRKEILAAGCDDVVTKPFRENTLFAKLSEHLDVRFLTREKPAASGLASLTQAMTGARPEAGNELQGTIAPEAPGGVSRSGLRILVAEDNPANQVVAQRMLERLGHEVEIVGNGEDAVSAAEDNTFDLIFMDIRMPKLDGLEATRLLRRTLPPGRQPVILALTGLVSEEERRRSMDAGVDEILAKPFRLQDLEAALDRWLRQPRAPEEDPEQQSSDPAEQPTPHAATSSAASAAVQRPWQQKSTQPLSTTGWEPKIDATASRRILDRSKLAQLHQLDDGTGSVSLAGQVISLFLDTVPGQLEDLRHAVQDRDRHRWRKVAHSLKNSSATLGAEEVADACQELEELGRRANPDEHVYEMANLALRRVTAEIRRALRALDMERSAARD